MSRLLALFLAVALGLAPGLAAQDRRQGEIRAQRVDNELLEFQEGAPATYRPLVIAIDSTLAVEDEVTIELETYSRWTIHRSRHRVAPGESLRVEIPFPLVNDSYFRLETSSARRGSLGAEFVNVPHVWRGGGPKTVMSFNALLVGSERVGTNSLRIGGHDLATVSLVDPRGYRRWQSYLGLDLVILAGEAVDDLHPDARLALRTWLETGGSLMVHAAREDAVAALVRTFPTLPTRFTAGAQGRDVGFGRIVAGREDPLAGDAVFEDYVRELVATGSIRHRLAAEERQDPGRSGKGPYAFFGQRPVELPGIGGVSARVFAFVILVFGILVGPVNLIVLSKLRRRVWALFTIPLLSFCAFAGIVGYALVAEGREVQVLARSITVLDQTTQRAATQADIGYYTGLSPARGLEFDGDLAVFSSNQNVIGSGDGRFGMDWSAGTRAFGQWLPARTTTILRTAGARTARERLEIESTRDACTVRNSLGVDLRRLMLVDAEGRAFTGAGIPAGTRAALEPTKALPPPESYLALKSSTEPRRHWRIADLGALAPLRPGEYAALLAAPLKPNYGTTRAAPRPGLHVLRGKF